MSLMNLNKITLNKPVENVNLIECARKGCSKKIFNKFLYYLNKTLIRSTIRLFVIWDYGADLYP